MMSFSVMTSSHLLCVHRHCYASLSLFLLSHNVTYQLSVRRLQVNSISTPLFANSFILLTWPTLSTHMSSVTILYYWHLTWHFMTPIILSHTDNDLPQVVFICVTNRFEQFQKRFYRQSVHCQKGPLRLLQQLLCRTLPLNKTMSLILSSRTSKAFFFLSCLMYPLTNNESLLFIQHRTEINFEHSGMWESNLRISLTRMTTFMGWVYSIHHYTSWTLCTHFLFYSKILFLLSESISNKSHG